MTTLISHITRRHCVKMQDYRDQFPGVAVQRMSAAQRQKISSRMKAKLEDPTVREAFMAWRSFPSEVKHWTRKGLTLDEAELKVKDYQLRAAAAQDNPATKMKQSVRTKGAANPMSLQSIAMRHGVTAQEARSLTPGHGRVGALHPMHGKKHTPEALGKIASAPHLSDPDYRSLAERAVAAFCMTLGACRHNARISRWNVDVLFDERKLVIEYFGDYWHMNPQRYAADDMHNLMRKTAQEIWDRDARKFNELKAAGYDVIVVWEADWRADEAAQLQRIKDAYDRAQ